MRRVYVAFFVRKATGPLALESYALVAFFSFLASQVSLSHIVANAPRLTDIHAWYAFSASAFLNTEFIVQALSIGALCAVVLLAKDIAKILAGPVQGSTLVT